MVILYSVRVVRGSSKFNKNPIPKLKRSFPIFHEMGQSEFVSINKK
jgi:hypothetical protein